MILKLITFHFALGPTNYMYILLPNLYIQTSHRFRLYLTASSTSQLKCLIDNSNAIRPKLNSWISFPKPAAPLASPISVDNIFMFPLAQTKYFGIFLILLPLSCAKTNPSANHALSSKHIQHPIVFYHLHCCHPDLSHHQNFPGSLQ